MTIFSVDESGKATKHEDKPLDSEKELENFLEQHPQTLQDDMFIIGRQVATVDGKFIDLLGIDKDGAAVIVELKKDKTPRQVIAQIIQYAQWIAEDVDTNILNEIAKDKKYLEEFPSIWKKFESTFSTEDAILNESQKLYIVAESIDPQISKMVQYLRTYKMNIMCVEMKFHKTPSGELQLERNFIVPKEEEMKSFKKFPKSDEKEYDMNYYSNYHGWDEKRIQLVEKICASIIAYSTQRGWNMLREFNKYGIVFRRAPKGEKYGDRRVVSIRPHTNGKLHIVFRWLRDENKKPKGNLNLIFNKSRKRWHVEIDENDKIDLTHFSDFENILTNAYNATINS